MPKPVQKEVLDVLARKATAVMTNVPGPQTQLTLAGGRLKQILFWVPQSGDIGIGVSILSYNGGVQIGVIADKKLCPNPQEICDRFAPEFEKLAMGLLLNPWWPEVVAHMAADAKEAKEAKSAPQVLPPESALTSTATKPRLKKRSPFAAARNG
jgi:WS/DGAT C-terminal domain